MDRAPGPDWSQPTYARGVVAADHRIGSQAGLDMLRQGGNAVDAAVAAAFCQAVVRPYSCGLGGGGFMVVYLNRNPLGRPVSAALIYRERTPSAVGPEYYVSLGIPDASTIGPDAVGIPGTVAGLLETLDRYGTLDRGIVLQPAIAAARDGFAIDDHYVGACERVIEKLEQHPEWRQRLGEPGFRFLWERFLFSGHPTVGDTLKQPELARTLEMIEKYGASGFYAGPVAAAIIEACPQMTQQDLAAFEVESKQPLKANRLGYRFLAMPLPSSGGVAMLETLRILEHYESVVDHAPGPADPGYAHLLTEAMKHAFADRARWLADDQYASVPLGHLLDNDRVDRLAERFDPARTLDSQDYGSSQITADVIEDAGTSHLSVVDRWGNAAACTETINLEFGSLLCVPEFGLVLNNEMDDFVTDPGQPNAFGLVQSDRNLPEPGKRPLSSMSPTIVLDDAGHVVAVAGASGGPRIISGTLQVLLNGLLFRMSPNQAVAAPRIHHQWLPNTLWFENRWKQGSSDSYDPLIRDLRDRGHAVDWRPDIGNVQLILRAPDGTYGAASDPRKGGEPAGW